MNRYVSVLALSGIAVLAGCVAPTPKPNDPEDQRKEYDRHDESHGFVIIQ
jgi:outer membrane biogenesis lipoprotein LolB